MTLATRFAHAPTQWLRPEWPAPPQVRAIVTTRHGGVSLPPYQSMNVADHVGDASAAVTANRSRLQQRLELTTPPRWLKQVHGTRVVAAEQTENCCAADASVTSEPEMVCAVLTADCLPLLLCDERGSRVAAVHAGWRGLAAGIIEATVEHLRTGSDELLAWLGPAIGPLHFEVGDEVRDAFLAHDKKAAQAFTPARTHHWYADLYLLARQRLAQCGVTHYYGGGYCTYGDSERFYSYRRDGVTGRMASLIWLHHD